MGCSSFRSTSTMAITVVEDTEVISSDNDRDIENTYGSTVFTARKYIAV